MGIKLFWSSISPPCRAIRMVINAIKLRVDLKHLDILNKSYLTELTKLNPQHTVPTLIDDRFVIWDSHAISIYLIQKYGPNYALYSPDPDKRALINQRLHFDSGILYPALYNCVMPILFKHKKTIKPSLIITVKQAYNFVDTFLKESTWIAGDQITIADFSCMSTLSTLDYFIPITQKTTPHLFKYIKQCQQLPFYEELNQDGLDKLGKIIQERIIRT